jgi:hypothetical protein
MGKHLLRTRDTVALNDNRVDTYFRGLWGETMKKQCLCYKSHTTKPISCGCPCHDKGKKKIKKSGKKSIFDGGKNGDFLVDAWLPREVVDAIKKKDGYVHLGIMTTVPIGEASTIGFIGTNHKYFIDGTLIKGKQCLKKN